MQDIPVNGYYLPSDMDDLGPSSCIRCYYLFKGETNSPQKIKR